MTKEEAISIIEDRIRVTEYVESSYVDCVDIEALRMAIKALETQAQWIPCEEDIPDEDFETGMGVQFSRSVLISVVSKDSEKIMVDVGHTVDGKWFSETCDEYVERIADWKVIAWMPQPEPYKGDQE